jgi:hypothetical protein
MFRPNTLKPLLASNDGAPSEMDGPGGRDAIDEIVACRLAVASVRRTRTRARSLAALLTG